MWPSHCKTNRIDTPLRICRILFEKITISLPGSLWWMWTSSVRELGLMGDLVVGSESYETCNGQIVEHHLNFGLILWDF